MKIRILNATGDEQIILSEENFESIKNRVSVEGLVLVEPKENKVIDFTGIDWNQIEKMEAEKINEMVAFRPVAGG